MSKPIYLSPEDRELLIDVVKFVKANMDDPGNTLDSGIARFCKRYCSRRLNSILSKLSPPEKVDE